MIICDEMWIFLFWIINSEIFSCYYYFMKFLEINTELWSNKIYTEQKIQIFHDFLKQFW